MIALLKGTIAHIDSSYGIVDVNGVGYKVFMPGSVLNSYMAGEEATIHITTVVLQDAITLYGFSSALQRDTFEAVCTVNKVGSKLGLAILSTLSIESLATAVSQNDTTLLSTVPGVGKKTASRICLDLAGKLPSAIPIVPSTTKGRTLTAKRPAPDPLQLALAQLDYRKSEIDSVLNSGAVPSQANASLEERLRAALRFLATNS